jgi:hypothetical protein
MSGDDRRESDRRERDRRASGRALVPLDQAVEAPRAEKTADPAVDPAFSAQLLGQDGQRRGLKGGPPVLGAARSGYLKAQHSGASDRRPKPGGVIKSET